MSFNISLNVIFDISRILPLNIDSWIYFELIDVDEFNKPEKLHRGAFSETSAC